MCSQGSRSKNTLSCSATSENVSGVVTLCLPKLAPVQMFVSDTVNVLLELKYKVGTKVKLEGDNALLIISTANELAGCGFAHSCHCCPAVFLSWSMRVPGEPAQSWFTARARVFVMMGHTESKRVSFPRSNDSVKGEDTTHHSPKCVRCSCAVSPPSL